MLTQERLKELLDYDPETGVFTWKVDRHSNKLNGKIAGYKSSDGYKKIEINNKSYLLHRLVWLYVYGELPEKQIDHINHIRDDNRLCNLRESSSQNNCRNRIKHSNKRSSIYKGVFWQEVPHRKWRSIICVDGKNKHLGYFDDEYRAALFYDWHAIELHGKFAHTNFSYDLRN